MDIEYLSHSNSKQRVREDMASAITAKREMVKAVTGLLEAE